MSQTGTAYSGSGGGTGKASVRDLTFMKYVDRASPTLLKSCCSGRHFAKARLIVRKAGGGGVEYLKIELNDGIVSGVTVTAGQGNERFTEHVSLNFASFKCEYTPQTASGRAGGVIPAQWNIAKNAES
jgi:type VI secretion system secreted protein Hcp